MRRWTGRALLASTTIAVAVAVSVVAWRQALARPVVVTYDVAVPGWTAPPLRLVQLSDIHMGPPDMPAARVAAIVAQATALRPDVVVVTGDFHGGKFVDGEAGNLDDAVRPLAGLRARFGVFAVRGNHDEPFWTPRVVPRYGLVYLENTHADAGPLTVAGVDDLSTGSPDIPAALRGIAPGRPVVLLMHEPDGFVGVPRRVALTLAGHTHGGQVRLPLVGAPITNTRFGYVRGRYVVAGRTLIVSSGLGTSALPIRLGVPPEIVVVTLHAPSAGRTR